MVKRNSKSEWSATDKTYGWVFGCEGFVNSVKAAEMIGKSQGWLSGILNGQERKRRNGKGYPIRAAKSGRDWSVCVRSIREYLALNQPVEV